MIIYFWCHNATILFGMIRILMLKNLNLQSEQIFQVHYTFYGSLKSVQQ